MLRAFMVFAAVAAIAVPAVLFVTLSDRYRACYVGDSRCYTLYGQLVSGSGFIFRNAFFGVGFHRNRLTVAVRSLKNSERPTAAEYADRRKELKARIYAKRDARRAAMAAYIARTGDAGKIPAEQPPN